MAVRLTSASSQSLSRSANAPSLTAFTICGWTSRVSNANYGALVALENGGASAYLTLQMDSTSTSLTCFMNGGGSFGCGSKALSTPYFFCLSCSGTAAGNVKVYIRAATATTLESYDSTSAGSITSFTPSTITVGTDQFGEYYDGAFWNVRCWDRALSAAEVLIESYYRLPKFPSSINFYWPCDNATNLSSIDLSGNARPPTLAGTPTTADGVYGLWAPRRRIFIPTAAAGGTAALSGSALASALGTLAPATDKALSGQALTSAQGTATPVLAVALSGSALTSSGGTVTPNLQIGLTGQSLSFGQGTLSASAGGDVTVSISGQALTASAGNLAPALDKAVSGSSATSSAGTLAPVNAIALTGAGITSAQGTLTFVGDVTVALTGLSMTFSQGALSPPAADTVTPAGKSRRKRYLLEIDGQYFEVADAQHAQAILDRAREVAKSHAEELTREKLAKSKKVGKRPIALRTPKVDSPDPELREVIHSARKAINAVYKDTALDTELAVLLARHLEEEDEEEAILLLL